MRALLGLALLAATASAQTYHVYLGTYTSKAGSKGIYRADFDAATGKLGQPELVAEVESPSFLHVATDGKTLYSVGEGGKEGSVYSFKIDAAGKLSDKVTLSSGGGGACHVSTDAAGKYAVVSNYGGGSYAFYSLKPDGGLGESIGAVEDVTVPKKSRGHCGFFHPAASQVFACDAGRDVVNVFDVRGTGPTPRIAEIKFPAGTAPRHIHIAPAGEVAFVNGEANMTVNLLTIDLKANKFEVAQTLSTLREGEKVVKGWSTAECRIHPGGKFVYVSNRGHDTIAAFKYDATAKKLAPAGHITGAIKTPRNFNISPDGKWMLIANQDGGTVGVYEIDQTTGLAKESANALKIDKCVCVKFLEKK